MDSSRASQVRFEARSFRSALFISGAGVNETAGWSNWFEKAADGVYEFKQEQPDDSEDPINIAVPFHAIAAFPLQTALRGIRLRLLVDGQVEERGLDVSPASVTEEAGFLSFRPYQSDDAYRPPTRAREFTKHLGTVDIPGECATWDNPLRARRHKVYVHVKVRTDGQDLRKAVEDCLRDSAIVAALAYLLTPIGWASGMSTFAELLKACLLRKLRDVVSVRVYDESSCR